MRYQPITCVWEVTMGCNMRCGHCGSSCSEPLPDELTTAEALDVCEQIAALRLRWITLSGGEPLTRHDLSSLVKRLSSLGVSVNIITNGWLLDSSRAEELKDSGVSTIAVSIDGTRELHDRIRKDGAYDHAKSAIKHLNTYHITAGAVTTITRTNLSNLKELKEELIQMGVSSWQVQLGLPMGNLEQHTDWVLEPADITELIDFCYETAKEGRIKIYPADCIGYYTTKEMEVKKLSFGGGPVSLWDGCNAGIRSFGILQNGDILGCTSIRSKEFIEGNLRECSLRDIWETSGNFKWRRDMDKGNLSGYCSICTYAGKCLGGCPNTRLTMNGDIYGENQYCAYHLELQKMEKRYKEITNPDILLQFANTLMQEAKFQEAAFALKQAIQLAPDFAEALKAKGYCEYMCGNYQACLDDNKKAMDLGTDDAFAIRGYAIALKYLGRQEESLTYMQKAVDLSHGNPDFVEDLRIMKL